MWSPSASLICMIIHHFMNKILTLISAITLIISTTPMTARTITKDKEDHTLTRLWSSFYAAQKADTPKDEAAILTQIKQEASARHLTWDYYDACDKYVDVRTSSNWKLSEEIGAKRREEIEKF